MSRKEWGPITWILFHSLANKIKPEYYNQMKGEMLQQIKSICNFLPCPECREHASKAMQKLTLQHVQTKEQFITSLHSFHNYVNNRLHKSQFSHDKLNKYDLAVLPRIVMKFIHVYSRLPYNQFLITESMIRRQGIRDFSNWFFKNQHLFS